MSVGTHVPTSGRDRTLEITPEKAFSESGEISACVTKGKTREALAEECADLLILLIGTAISGDFRLDEAFWNKMGQLGNRESRIIEGRIRVSEFRET